MPPLFFFQAQRFLSQRGRKTDAAETAFVPRVAKRGGRLTSWGSAVMSTDEPLSLASASVMATIDGSGR